MALAILEFRDDTADSIMLPPYVVGRCGDRGSGHSSNINKNKELREVKAQPAYLKEGGHNLFIITSRCSGGYGVCQTMCQHAIVKTLFGIPLLSVIEMP